MKIKQTSIVLCIDRYGLNNYANLIKKLNDGWLVNRVDYIYNNAGQPVHAVYIIEKEDEA